MFAQSLDDRIGAANMYRVFHCADPVPMVPLFPFFHVPAERSGYKLGNGSRGLISLDVHNMEGSYIPGVSRQSWTALRHRDRSEEHTSELQSLMRNTYAVFCLKKNKQNIK